MIFTQGLSLNKTTAIVGVFLYNKTYAPKIFARKCEILNIFLIIYGSHLGFSLEYHIPEFIHTWTNIRMQDKTLEPCLWCEI